MPHAGRRKMEPVKPSVTIANAEQQMTQFIKFYKGIELVPESEWKVFLETLLSPCPMVFRIGENHRKYYNALEGKPNCNGQAEVLRDFMKSVVLPQVANEDVDEEKFKVSPLPWYPKELAWKCNVSLEKVQMTPKLKNFCDFVFQEERSNFVFRQDVTGMIAPLLVDINSNHKVLEFNSIPGFQTCQILEALHSNSKKPAEGFVVCNDSMNAKMNFRWTRGPNTMFTHYEPEKFPDMFTTEEHSPDSKIAYNRIFLDPTTSNDGTMRTQYEVRSAWSIQKAMKQHKSLKDQLRRGLELLEIDGQLVYSTSSLNPVENEGVVAGLLKEAPEVLELVDVRSRLKGLITRPGMDSWKIISQGGVFYETFEGSPNWFQKETAESMFPPSAEDAGMFNLDRCIRLLPHDNDTAAGFYAVFRKLGPLPSEKEAEEKMETEAAEEKVKQEKENGEEKKEEEKKEEKEEDSNKPPYTKPLRCDVSVSVMEINWDTEITDNNLHTTVESDVSTFKQPNMRISKTSIPSWYHKKMQGKWSRYEEVEASCVAWVNLRKMYDLRRLDPATYMLKFVEEHRGTSFYFMTPALKNLIKCNPEVAKKSRGQCAGLMLMKVDDCDQGDMSVFGHLPLLQYMGKRLINITSADLVTILNDRALSIKTLSDKVQRELIALGDKGPVYFVYEPKTKSSEPKCPIVMRRDKYKSILKDNSIRHGESNHFLRLCGIDPTKEDDDDDDETDMNVD